MPQIITIDVTDWLDEYMAEEADVTTLEALIDRATQDGLDARQLARLVIIARERGDLSEDMEFPPNKALLNNGGGLAVNMMMAQQKRRIEMGDGTVHYVRELIAPLRDSHTASENHATDASHNQCETQAQDAHTFESVAEVVQAVQPAPRDASYAFVGTPLALDRALAYLDRVVPGYIMGRLLIIRESGGDVGAAADVLKERIDEMVEELG